MMKWTSQGKYDTLLRLVIEKVFLVCLGLSLVRLLVSVIRVRGLARRFTIKSFFFFHYERIHPLAEDLMRLSLDGVMTHIDRVFRVYATLDEFIYFAVGDEFSRFLGLCGCILLFCRPSLLWGVLFYSLLVDLLLGSFTTVSCCWVVFLRYNLVAWLWKLLTLLSGVVTDLVLPKIYLLEHD